MPAREPVGVGERGTAIKAELEIVPGELLRANTPEAPLEGASTVKCVRYPPAKLAAETSVVECLHESPPLPA